MTDHRPEVRECLLEYMALADKICYTEPELSQYHVMKAKAKAALSVAESPSVRAALKKLLYECLANDFNEHWDSYKQAHAALAAQPPVPVVEEVVTIEEGDDPADGVTSRGWLPDIHVPDTKRGDRVRVQVYREEA